MWRVSSFNLLCIGSYEFFKRRDFFAKSLLLREHILSRQKSVIYPILINFSRPVGTIILKMFLQTQVLMPKKGLILWNSNPACFDRPKSVALFLVRNACRFGKQPFFGHQHGKNHFLRLSVIEFVLMEKEPGDNWKKMEAFQRNWEHINVTLQNLYRFFVVK